MLKFMTLEKLADIYNNLQLEEIEQYEGSVYHYTSSKAARKIVQEKVINATDVCSLGDKNEWVYVLDLMGSYKKYLLRNYPWAERKFDCGIKAAKNTRELFFSRYVISLSVDGVQSIMVQTDLGD